MKDINDKRREYNEPLTMEITLPRWAFKHMDKQVKELIFDDINDYLVYIIRKDM